MIALKRLTKSYGPTRVLDDVDLEIRKGEFLTLLGPSGSGKTTLLSLIAGVALPDSGRIELEGRDITHFPPERRGIGVVFQNYALFPHLNVGDNVAFPLKMRRLPRAARTEKVQAALRLVKLTELAGRRVSELSGGQQQRVALARALVFDPPVLLMDEPLSALDKKLRDHMRSELRHIQQTLGLTIVYVTHDQGEALALSSRVALMNGGRILQLGTPKEIYERPRTRFVADFVGDANLLSLSVARVERGRMVVRLGSNELVVRVDSNHSSRGENALVLIRPEHIQAGPFAGALENVVRGRLVSAIYEGAGYLLAVDIGDTVLRARVPDLEGAGGFMPGRVVELGFAAERAHVVEADDPA